ncbi:LysM peptidoglycan-binding domain-containing protein [Prosthecobacter sp.]|uniref:LysM peptidoglycan-binding domain-containing protein n=1 Tax=Prosthecobacter sp. TaxID=1965333 RepID=UPI0037842CE5
MTAHRLLALSFTCLALASCENMKKSGSSSSDPYASNYGSDGHYNPYPGQTGYASSTPKYQTPPAPSSFPSEPQAPADPYSFGGSKKPAPSGMSSSTPKKTVASSSSAKKKPTSSKSKTTAKKSSGSRYTVAKGDTLSAIARKKGTSVAKIRAANGISGDLIRPGQSLKIP